MNQWEEACREALKYFGWDRIDTPEKARKVLAYYEIQRKIRSNQLGPQRIRDHGTLSNHIFSLLSEVAPALPPLRKVLERALRRRKLPTSFQKRQIHGGYLLDFAFPEVNLCIRLGDANQGDDYLKREGWHLIRFSEEEVRHFPQRCVDNVFFAFKRIKRMLRLRLRAGRTSL